LKHYDYSNAGAYFITLCIQDRQYLLGHIQEGVAVLSDIGRIAQEQWFNLPHRFTNVRLDAFVVMPNHIHGILFIDPVGAPYGRPQGSPLQAVVGAYKSLVHLNALLMAKRNGLFLGHLWQRNYWEHVVRNDEELNRIREYIRNNPHTWEEDRLYKMNLTAAANVAGILGE
jgi:REP element-mobilizing transposase RayT